ncbi:MAG: hypothetical protein ACTSPY_03795 [Candidatus Helarchaeota archaeon]
MVKNCDFCNNKGKLYCKIHKKTACRDHAVKCPYCNNVICIDCFRYKNLTPVCSHCKKSLLICPECLKNGIISRLQQGTNICKKCNYKR